MSAPAFEGLNLSPAPGAAPRGRRVLRHAGIEASLLVRNSEQLLLALVIPLGLLVAGLLFGEHVGLDRRVFPASVLALALWSTSFTSLAIATGFERRYGVLERLVATPLTRGDLVVGKALANGAIALGQVVVLTLAAFTLGWRPSPAPAQVPVAVAAALLAVTTFACFALALAGRLRAEATLGLANLIYIVVAVVGGLVIPIAAYPSWAQPVVGLLPSAALGESLRALASGMVDPFWLIVLVVWLVAALVVARKAFRWTS